ncbi:PIN domain-containing protein [Nocardia sp. NBC_00565]|uniref:PIN domain-containing protein n=1 Tax=Nocardia sp. NBC_00565 TaxID=2975993 RepID=UPI002E8218F3|nr:PIN domain-containing protein [Nocardia sp. NBC_00565]WUC03528.1 PIN domain-containing protein [Nocardia sp. NBC_00565]
MIILDTSILRGLGLKSSTAELLRAIRESGVQRISVPWMVLEELAAQQVLKYTDSYEKACAAQEQLTKLTPWSISRLAPPRVDKVRDHWRAEYQKLTEVIEIQAEILAQALYREANLIPPAKRAGDSPQSPKIGARDAVIWLAAVGYARSNPTEKVYFVSGNTRDFGNGESRPEELNGDLKGIESRFVQMTRVDEVVQAFAEEVKFDPALHEEMMWRSEFCERIAKAASESLVRVWSESSIPNFFNGVRVPRPSSQISGADGWAERADELSVSWAEWTAPPTAANLVSVEDGKSYRIENKIWSIVTTRWLLIGDAFLANYNTSKIACLWTTRLLVSNDSSPVVLDYEEPRGLRPADAKSLVNVPPF